MLESQSQDCPSASKETIVLRNTLKPTIGEFAELAKLLTIYMKHHPIQVFVKIIVPYEIIQSELFWKLEMSSKHISFPRSQLRLTADGIGYDALTHQLSVYCLTAISAGTTGFRSDPMEKHRNSLQRKYGADVDDWYNIWQKSSVGIEGTEELMIDILLKSDKPIYFTRGLKGEQGLSWLWYILPDVRFTRSICIACTG